jgi:hypothetical protein
MGLCYGGSSATAHVISRSRAAEVHHRTDGIGADPTRKLARAECLGAGKAGRLGRGSRTRYRV